MGRKLQTIYEYLSDYTEKEIDDAIFTLSMDDKLIIRERYGEDLHNPLPRQGWNRDLSVKFYSSIIPKLKNTLLQNRKNNTKEEIIEIPSLESTIKSNDIVLVLMDLLRKGKDTEEICNILKIDNKTLYKLLLELKNKGVKFTKDYSIDGDIHYKFINKISDLKQKAKTIIVPESLNSVKILAISDLHFGNQKERLDLVDRAYNYCIKNDIHLIFCGGDIIDGAYSKEAQKITNSYEQAEYLIEKYPYDKSILTFAVGGDHDFSAFYRESIDIIEMCDNYRHDIVIGNYNNAIINMKKDKIQLYHYIKGGVVLNVDTSLMLHGHMHDFGLRMQQDRLNVTLPSLSDIANTLPSALEITLNFKNDFIESTDIKHLYFDNKDMVLSESHLFLPENRKIKHASNIVTNSTEDTLVTDEQVKKLSKSMMHLS